LIISIPQDPADPPSILCGDRNSASILAEEEEEEEELQLGSSDGVGFISMGR
jgi:hypothetical protein